MFVSHFWQCFLLQGHHSSIGSPPPLPTGARCPPADPDLYYQLIIPCGKGTSHSSWRSSWTWITCLSLNQSLWLGWWSPLIGRPGQIFTLSTRTLGWALPKLCQDMICPGETEVLIDEDEGMDIDRKKQHKTITNTKSIIGALGGSGQILWLFYGIHLHKLVHMVVFGLTMVWNELANSKQLCLNLVTREPLGWCWWSVSCLSTPWTWESSSRHCLPLWRLTRLRLPGALPGGHPVKQGNEVITGLANFPLAVLW